MNPVAQQFLVGAVVPGTAGLVICAAAWWRQGIRERVLTDGSPTHHLGSSARWPRLLMLALVLGVVAFVQSYLLSAEFVPGGTAVNSVPLVVLVLVAIGALSVGLRLPKLLLASLSAVAVTAGTMYALTNVLASATPATLATSAAGLFALSFLGVWSWETLARLNPNAVVAPSRATAVAGWLWCGMATQVAVVGFSSLKWGLHAHGLAAVFGGAMLVAAIRPRLSLAGVAGPVAAIVAMLLAVPSQIGGDSMPAWLRLTLVSLVLLSPLPAAVILPRVSPRPSFVGLLIRVVLIAGLSMLAAGIAVAIFVMTPAEPAY